MRRSVEEEPAFPVLHTKRLLLRKIDAFDVPALFEIHSDAGAMKWFGSEPIVDLEGAKKLVELFAGWRKQTNPATRWGIQKKGCATLIGTCGLFAWNRAWGKCALGYELAASAQGEGYMGEALDTVLDWGFANMQLNRVEALIHPSNEASLRLLHRLGFVEEGRLRQGARWGEQFHDMLQYALLRQDWTSQPASG